MIAFVKKLFETAMEFLGCQLSLERDAGIKMECSSLDTKLELLGPFNRIEYIVILMRVNCNMCVRWDYIQQNVP